MSRTDKDRPYNVQRHDKTLNIPELHDHRKGECDFYTLEKWKRRYNDRKHRVYGSLRLMLSFSCEQRVPRPAFYKMFPRTDQEDPQVLMLRKQLKRRNRHNARQQSRMVTRATRSKHAVELLHDLGDQLTTKQPQRPYHNTGQVYTKTKRPYVYKQRQQPPAWQPTVTFEEWRANPYAYYRKHRMNVKSMHGKANKAAN